MIEADDRMAKAGEQPLRECRRRFAAHQMMGEGGLRQPSEAQQREVQADQSAFHGVLLVAQISVPRAT
jgi:hypothetical protein